MMERIEALRGLMRDAGLDAFCVRDTANIAYLTGFDEVFDDERAHALLLDGARALLHTDSRYASACRRAAALGGGDIQIDDEAVRLPQWLADAGILGTLGIEDSITLAEFRQLQEALSGKVAIEETSGLVGQVRSVKSMAEVARLKAAQAITDAAFAHVVPLIKPGMTEKQVQLELDSFMLSHGASSLAFPTIVATGPNGANPHAQPTDARLEAGQCVVMDFGAKLDGYCSDMTRMVFLGVPDEPVHYAYDTLIEVNASCRDMVRPGVAGAEVHQHALDLLEQAGFGGRMGHGLGHGVGLEVHELPNLSVRNEEPLVAGNVVTVEPGIYFEGEFGMRLEDCGVVAEDGFEVFSTVPRNMVIV